MINITTHIIEHIGSILDYVHDRFFYLDRIVFDKDKEKFIIPLNVVFPYPDEASVCPAQLTIKHATNFSVEDVAEIGEADINTIVYEKGYVTIVCGIPVTIAIKVNKLEISLDIEESVVLDANTQ